MGLPKRIGQAASLGGLFLFLLVPATQAGFESRPLSARAAAMGGVLFASAQEPAAVFTHPAGLAPMTRGAVSFLYGKPFAGLPGIQINAGHGAFALPTRFGTLGAGYSTLQFDGLLSEETLALSYGARLGRAWLGGTAKRLSHAYDTGGDVYAGSDPVFAHGTSKAAWAFDASAVVPLGQALKAGLAVRNMNRPNVGLAVEDRVQREIQGGFQLEMAGLGMKASGEVLMKSAVPGLAETSPLPAFGLEKRMATGVALRLGANPREITTGAGLRVGGVTVDYAFAFNKDLAEDNFGSHKLGVTYSFRTLEGR